VASRADGSNAKAVKNAKEKREFFRAFLAALAFNGAPWFRTVGCHGTSRAMSIPEEKVAAVVAEVSGRMREPSYAQAAISAFITAHPDASRFVALKMTPHGGTEAAMHALFHAEVVAECVRRERGVEALSALSFPELDAVATREPLEALAAIEPALAGYLSSNTEGPMRGVVAHVALGLVRPI
jgi:hypothetical protein